MNTPRPLFRLLAGVVALFLPLMASAATTELRVLFDTDNNGATGCTVSGLAGVDQVLVTLVTDSETSASVTQTHRQVCTGGVLGAPIDVVSSGWAAGWQPASGHLLVETRLPFTAFGSSAMPSTMRVAFTGVRGVDSFRILVQANGSHLMVPPAPGVRHQAVRHPGPVRVITLDGQDGDWTGIPVLTQGSAGGGSSDIKLLRALSYANPNDFFLYFNFNLNVSGKGLLAVNDVYTRTQGAPTFTQPAPGVLSNDVTNGPATAVPVAVPDDGDVVLNPDGGFTYTPNDPNAVTSDTFIYKAVSGTDESNIAKVRIDVERVDQEPLFTSATTAQFQAGAASSFTVIASGTPDPSLSSSGALPGGVTFTDNGNGTATLGGTPVDGTGGVYALVFTATNSAGTVTQNFTLVVCNIITVTNPATTTGTANAAFSQTFTQTGAVGTAVFTTTSTLPAGLTLATNGTLSGTPTQTGSFPIVVRVTDDNGCTNVGATYTLVIGCQTITVTNPATTTGTANAAFSQTFTQTGAIGSATFTTASTLPTGLTLATSGTLSGTPTQTGSFPIVVTVTDANNCTGTGATYTLVIGCQSITVTNPATTTGTAGAAFSQTFTQTGAIGTATFTTASTLPAGLTLATNGTLSGTPTPTGSFPIVVTVTDANSCTGTGGTYTLVIGCQSIAVTNPATTTATVGTAFSQTFTQVGAIGGATFSTASTLPTGFTLAANGTLSGTTNQFGTFPIVVTVTDGNGCTGTGATYTLVVSCQTITVTNPANATGPAGSPFSETFTQTGAIGAATFTTASTLPTGLTLSTAGVLSGTPNQGGTFPVVVTVTDSNGCTGTGATYTLVITCPTITVTNPANANGTANAAFSETFTQTGGVGAATFTLASGTLPTGLTLATNGVLSGTPTQTGSFPITVTATDSNGCTGTGATYTLVIACQTISVTNPANANGTASSAFSETFTQTGAIGTATFTLASGTLPAGLTLATNGVLSGTPTQTGSFPITVTGTDSNGCTGTGTTYTIVIACQTITVNNPATTTGTVSAAFSQTFTQTNAIGTATFTTASTLPAGITLAANGLLSGTPTQTGSFPIVVTVTDGNGCTGTGATYTLVIGCQTITVNNPANAAGTVSAAFSETFTQTGAVGSATFTLNSGVLPAGITLATNGVLSGTPTQSGSFPITVLVTDGNSCTGVSATYTLVIGCQTITVTNPANATGPAGSPFSETFTQTGAIGTATFTTASTLPTGLTLSTAGVLSGTPTQGGTFPIVVTVTDSNGCTGTSATYNLIVTCPVISVTNPANANGTANAAFSETFTQTGGVGTATFTLATGTLPTGLTLAANGVLSGTPTQTGSFPITVTATDSNGCTGTGTTYTIVIACQTIAVTNPANANGTASAAFSETFTQVGAIGTATFTLASGTLPAGLTLAANGVLSGTPTQTGSFPITVLVTDSNGCTGTGATYTIVIACQTITVNNPATTTGTVSAAFSETFTQTGGIGSATFTTASTLPAGLTLATSGTLSGTPTQTGSFPIVVTITDGNGCTGTGANYALVIGCQTITVNNPANPNGTVSAAFSETFTQSGAVGSATFTTASTLPAGLTLATNGVLSGTPTQSGSFPIVVIVTDGNSCTGTSATYNLVIACQTITVNNPANATGPAGSPFSETFTQTGAIGTATFTTASTLPTGLSLSTGGVLSGTPNQGGTFPIVVTVTDSNGCTGTSATYNLTITCPAINVTNPATTTGTANAAFSQTFTQTGAIGGATFTLASGTLPAGLTLATNGVLSGTPTQSGSFPITVLVTDGNGCTGTGATYTLVIGCQTINVNNPANANGTANAAFSETFTQTGAIGTATFTLASGTLPAGLTLAANGTLSGTPTQTGSFPITVTVTDSNGCTGTGATYTIVIGCQTITVTNPANAAGTILVAFSETFSQGGSIGTAAFTLNSGTLPAGLTLLTAGVLSGTPTVTGSFPITVLVTDSNGCTGVSATYTIVISCQTINVTNPGVSTGTVSAVFSQTFTQTGANGGATFTLNSGTLPAGLTLATNGVLSGTPTQSGSFPITVLVTDGNSCAGVSATYNLTIACQTITVTNPANAAGTANAVFSETFTQVGAIGTATFTTASTLPTGLSLSTAGVLSGTPTQTGNFPVVVTVTDSNGCTGTSATYNLTIGCQTITVTNPANTAGTASSAFSETFTQVDAIGTATFTTASTLPAGLTLATNGTLAGIPTQTGSFPIVVTVTDSNGCTGTGATYTLVIACQTITVNNPANVNGTAGVAFSETFTQTGAIGTATFTTASTLPAGLTLSAAGVLSGTPTQSGTFPIVVTVTDSNGCTGTGATYNLVIACPAFVFNPLTTMPTATFGVAYSQNITVTGGASPKVLTLANATNVPTSFTFTDNGNGSATIASANPTVTGVFTFDVNVFSSTSNCTQTQTFSFTVAPNVQNDLYSAANGQTDSVGNTQAVAAGFSTPTTPFVTYAASVLANDSAPGGTLTVVTASVTNAAGTITFNAAGGWSYVPTVNFTGTATFAFVVASNGAQANASISIVVTNKVWYVQNNSAAGGNGVSSTPFDTLAEAQTASAAGDIIYVDTGDGTTLGQTAGITLKDNQQLIGEGVALSVNSNALAAAGTKPQITNLSNAVSLANGNTVKGLTINGGQVAIDGFAAAGFTGDTLTIQNGATAGLRLVNFNGAVTLTNTTITNNGIGLSMSGGTATTTIDSTNTITANAGQRSVFCAVLGATAVLNVGATITDNGFGMQFNGNTAGAAISFTGTQTIVQSTGVTPGVGLAGNAAGSTFSFSGTLNITTTNGQAFSADGGTISVSGTANATTGATPIAISLNGITVGGSGITFNSVNTTNAGTAISLVNFAAPGIVTVNGGTITNGPGTTGVSLQGLNTSLTLANVTIIGGSGATNGIRNTTNFGTLTIGATVNVTAATALNLTAGVVSGMFNQVNSTGGTNGVTLTGVTSPGGWGATAGSLTGATGVTFNVSGGSGQITWGPSISQANGNRAVSIAASNSGIINFNGNVTSSGTSTGVILTASSGTYNFNQTNSFTGASGILISNGQSGNISFSNATTIGNVTNTPFQVDGSAVAVTAAITYGGTIAKTGGGALIDVNNLDTPGTLSMTHTPAAAGNLSISSNGSSGISVINSSSTNITISNASVTFQNANPGFTASGNTGGTINLPGLALTGTGNKAGMLFSGAGTINVSVGAANPSINLSGGSAAASRAIDGTTVAFTGTLNLTNVAITGNANADIVTLGGGTLGGTGSTISGANRAMVLSGVVLTNGAGMSSIASTGGLNGISLTNVTGGTYTVGSGGNLGGNTGSAFLVSGGTATFGYAGNITQNTGSQRAVDITGITGGTITLSGQVNSNGGTGINLAGTGGTVTISGVITLNNTGATYAASGAGLTVNVTNTGNTIGGTNAATGPAVSITGGTIIGASNVQFQSIDATGGANGIVLNNTGSSGRFMVTGNGGACSTAANCSGGAIQNTTGDGVSLTLTKNVSLTRMYIGNTGRHGVSGTTMTDVTAGAQPTFEFRNGFLDSPGDADNESALFFDTLLADNIHGVLTVADSTIQNFEDVGVHVGNQSGSLTVNVTNVLINNNSDTNGEEAIDVFAEGTANITVNVTGTRTGLTSSTMFTDMEGGGLNVVAQGSGVIDLNVSGIVVIGTGGPDNFPTPPAMTYSSEGTLSTFTFDLLDNAIVDSSGDGIFIGHEGAIMGRINNNIISGMATGDGIRIDTDITSNNTVTIEIDNNQMGNNATWPGIGDDGIQVLHRDGTKLLNLTITDNTIANTVSEAIRYFADDDVAGGGPENRVKIANNSFTTIGDPNTIVLVSQDNGTNVCTSITGNNLTTGNLGVTLQQSTGTATLQITQASAAALAAANDSGATVVTPTGVITFNGTCSNPPLPTNP